MLLPFSSSVHITAIVVITEIAIKITPINIFIFIITITTATIITTSNNSDHS